jgi:hypothetical protein
MITQNHQNLAFLIAAPQPGESAMHNDQAAIGKALLSRGLPADHILLLHGRLDRKLVLAALDNLRRRMDGWQTGSLFVHVSGHGYFVGENGESARAGLLLNDTQDVNDDYHLLWEEFFAALDLPIGLRLTLLPDL